MSGSQTDSVERSSTGSRTQSGESADRTPVENADVCVVGAGPAGALLAYSLAERGHEVVILEAGPRFDMEHRVDRMKLQIHPERGVDEIWDMGGERDAYSTSGYRQWPLNKRRVKGVGGTSLHWGGVTPRLREKDFEMESRYGVGKDWPISYEDLQPYYARAEQEIGVAGPDDAPHQPPREEGYPMDPLPSSRTDDLLTEAGEALDIDVQSMPMAINTGAYDRNQCQGYGTCEHVCPSGAKYTAEVHIEKAEEEGATVLTQTPVQRFEHGPDGEEVTGAVYKTPDGETHTQEADIFVAAAGAYENPRLLFLSESDQYPDGLANSSGTLGRYFMGHEGSLVVGVLPVETYQGAFGPVVSSGIMQFYEGSADYAGAEMMLVNVAGPSLAERAISNNGFGDDLLETVGLYGNSIGMLNTVEMLPRAENRITLDESKTDNHGNPVPDVQVEPGEFSRKGAEKTVEVATNLIEELGGNVSLAQGSISERDELIEDIKGGAHPMGGTRMGTDPTDSVVDPNLQTHDLDNLYISGGGVFVTGGAANPTLTIMALSLKAADHIHETLSS